MVRAKHWNGRLTEPRGVTITSDAIFSEFQRRCLIVSTNGELMRTRIRFGGASGRAARLYNVDLPYSQYMMKAMSWHDSQLMSTPR